MSNSQSNSDEKGCWKETLAVTSSTESMLLWTEYILWCIDSVDIKGFSCSLLPWKMSFRSSATVCGGTFKGMGNTIGVDCSWHLHVFSHPAMGIQSLKKKNISKQNTAEEIQAKGMDIKSDSRVTFWEFLENNPRVCVHLPHKWIFLNHNFPVHLVSFCFPQQGHRGLFIQMSSETFLAHLKSQSVTHSAFKTNSTLDSVIIINPLLKLQRLPQISLTNEFLKAKRNNWNKVAHKVQ